MFYDMKKVKCEAIEFLIHSFPEESTARNEEGVMSPTV
jgi:hypothetical protein